MTVGEILSIIGAVFVHGVVIAFMFGRLFQRMDELASAMGRAFGEQASHETRIRFIETELTRIQQCHNHNHPADRL